MRVRALSRRCVLVARILIRVSVDISKVERACNLSPDVLSFVDVCTVITILVSFSALTESRPTTTTTVLAPTTTATQPRWHRPCAGSAPVKLGHIWEQYEGRVPTINSAHHFERIAEKANWLKAKVHTLKSLYVSTRSLPDYHLSTPSVYKLAAVLSLTYTQWSIHILLRAAPLTSLITCYMIRWQSCSATTSTEIPTRNCCFYG